MNTAHSVLEFGIHVASKVTGIVGEHIVDETNEELNRNFDACSELARRDPNDHIYEEYENDSSADIFAWKKRRPAFYKSVLWCSFNVFRVVLLIGSFCGVIGPAFSFVLLNTVNRCDWMEDTDPRLPQSVRTIRSVLTGLGVIYVDHVMVLILCTSFTWSAVRHSRILAVNTVCVFADISYRVILQVHNIPFVPYPVNVLYLVGALHHCYAIGRKVFPRSNKSAVLSVATKLCVHLIAMVITTYIFIYAIFPWFITLHGVPKLLVATIAPVIFLPTKLLGRLCVLRLQGVIHPSTSFVLVSLIYAVDSVLARAMQADLIKMKMFVVYGVLHGTIHVLETLVVSTMGDWMQIFRRLCSGTPAYKVDEESLISETAKISQHKPLRSPRAQRLVADMSLQNMLHESIAVILTTSLIQMYPFVYEQSLSPDGGSEILTKLLLYIFIALFTEFFFHSLSVLLQTRYLNVPVMRVWEAKWRLHLWVTTSTTLICIVYFTPHFLPIIREKYKSKGAMFFNETCGTPFQ